MNYVAAFRTHVWDEQIAELAARLAGACASARFVVLADETRGRIDVSDYEKISHTDDTAAFGLPKYPPERSMFYNCDYALYFLHQALPDYDYYLVSEYDVAVNTDVDVIVRAAAERELDLVAHGFQGLSPSWSWPWYPREKAAAAFPEPIVAWIQFMLVSRRALLHLLSARQQWAATDGTAGWPFCELFIPSAINEMAGAGMAELGEFADVGLFRGRPYMRLEDERTSRPGTIVHPVHGKKQYLFRVLPEHSSGLRSPEDRASNYFRKGSALHQALEPIPFDELVEPLRAALLRERDHVGLGCLRDEMRRRGLPEDPASADLALCKPSLSSSVSIWSFSQDLTIDAAGANTVALPDDLGFHTAEETEPWWMVDLGAEYLVEEVTVVNRRQWSERFRTFTIESSRDSHLWCTRFAKLDNSDVSADPEAPWRVAFDDPFLARYVRIRLCGRGFLHLRRVQVFGCALHPPAARGHYQGTGSDQYRFKSIEIELMRLNPTRQMMVNRLWRGNDPLRGFSSNLFEYDLQGWNSQHVYLSEAIAELRPSVIVEVGVWKGGSTVFMANTARELCLPSLVIAVDTWLGSSEHWLTNLFEGMSFLNGYPALYHKFLSNVIRAGVAAYVLPMPIDSLNAAEILKSLGVTAEIMHLDGGHDYQSVMADLHAWWPVLVPGGMLIGDDYFPGGGWPGVRQAFDDFFGGLGLTPIENRDGKCRVHKPG
jgi:hypothetical protein